MPLTRQLAQKMMMEYCISNLGLTEEMAETLGAAMVKADTVGLVTLWLCVYEHFQETQSGEMVTSARGTEDGIRRQS